MVASAIKTLKERLIAWREPLAIVIGVRLGLGVLPLFTGFLYPPHDPMPVSGFASPSLSFWPDRLLGIWAHWDGLWYLKIATLGYAADPNSLVFFPLYPALVSLIGRLLAGNYLLAGVILSTGLSLVAAVLLYELIRHDGGTEQAERVVLYLVACPLAFYLYAVYTEALFLALVLGAFLAARRWRKWWLAGALAALAALTRSLGAVLALSLAWEWFSYQHANAAAQTGSRAEAWRLTVRSVLKPPVLATVLPIIALAGWFGFSGLISGNSLASLSAQQHWGRSFAWPWQTVGQAIANVYALGPAGLPALKPGAVQFGDVAFENINLYFLVLGLALLVYGAWACFRKWLPFSYLIYMGLGVMLPLVLPAADWPLQSYARYLLVLFPLFVLLAELGSRWRWLHYLYLGLSLALLGLFFVRFAAWYWVA